MFDRNDTITIWNRLRILKESDRLYRKVLRGCKFIDRLQSPVSGHGAVEANGFTVIIPETPLYRPYNEWAALDETGRGEYFTLAKGDVAALGGVDSAGATPVAIKAALGPYCFEIRTIIDNTRGKRGGHYRIEGN